VCRARARFEVGRTRAGQEFSYVAQTETCIGHRRLARHRSRNRVQARRKRSQGRRPLLSKRIGSEGRAGIAAITYAQGSRTGSRLPWVGMGSAKAALESLVRYFAVALAKTRHHGSMRSVRGGP